MSTAQYGSWRREEYRDIAEAYADLATGAPDLTTREACRMLAESYATMADAARQRVRFSSVLGGDYVRKE